MFDMPLDKGDLNVRTWFDEKTDDSGLKIGLPAFYLYADKQK